MKNYLFAVILILVAALPALAVERVGVAIMDFEPTDISRQDATKITELIRNEMVNVGLFHIVERSQVDKILKEQGFQQTGCTEISCAVQVGRLLSARKILVGTVMRFGTQIAITGRIVDVERGVAEFSEKATANSREDLVKAVERFAEKLSQRIAAEYKVKKGRSGSYDLPTGPAKRKDPNYRPIKDPTGWLALCFAAPAAVGFIYTPLFYQSKNNGINSAIQMHQLIILAYGANPYFGNPLNMPAFLSFMYYIPRKSTRRHGYQNKRDNFYMASGASAGVSLALIITFITRAVINRPIAAGEVYRANDVAVFLPGQYFSAVNLVAKKNPGLGLGVSMQW